MALRYHEWDDFPWTQKMLEWEDFEEKDQWLAQMLQHVKFKYDHLEIRREYMEHMEDMYEFYVSRGMSADQAKSAVLADMGDPEDLGRVLNEIHHPLLGWVWRISKWAAVFLAVVSVLHLLLLGIHFMDLFKGWDQLRFPEAVIVYQTDIDERVSVDNVTLRFVSLEEYEDGTIRIYFTERFHLLDRALQKDFGMGAGMITDENGTPDLYHTHHHAGWFYKLCSITVHEFPEDAEKLILNYDRKGREFRLEIPLGNGEVTA